MFVVSFYLFLVEDYYANLWSWINNNNEDALKIEKPISLLNRFSRMFGRYINRQKEKGNIVNNKYWEYFLYIVLLIERYSFNKDVEISIRDNEGQSSGVLIVINSII